LPAGSIITAASLGVTVTSSGGVASVFELRRTLQAWNEGGKGASNNQGDPASPGETTWLARAHPATLWTEPGGLIGSDFAPEAGASLLLSEPGTYTFASTAALVAEAQAWLDHPASNQGWMLMTTEERIANTSKRIAAREAGANAPTLTLEFTPPPLTPPIDRIERVGDQIELRFKIEAGRLYAVEFVEALPSTNWTTLSFAASKFFPTNWVATDSHLNGPQRFYRLAYRGEID
jgi:hypothetical protein